MQYKANTPQQYLEELTDDWRKEKLLEVVQLLQKEGAHLIQGIEYNMLSFSDETGTVFNLNAQANYVSLYVGDAAKVDASGETLKGFNKGKGCIRIKKSNEVQQLGAFIKLALSKRAAGGDIGC